MNLVCLHQQAACLPCRGTGRARALGRPCFAFPRTAYRKKCDRSCNEAVVQATMHVPSDSFGGLSPEKKASNVLRTLFTFCAAKVILAQLEGSGRGSRASYNSQGYSDLYGCLQEVPMKDGDDWLKELMKRNSMLALRVIEVRAAYCEGDFEWDTLQRVANRDMQTANQRLLQSHAESAFKAVLAQQGEGEEAGAAGPGGGSSGEDDGGGTGEGRDA